VITFTLIFTQVRVNLNGIFTVASASIVEKQEVEEEVPMEVDPPKDEKKESSEEKKGEENMDTAEAKEGANNADGSAAPKEPPKMEKRKKIVNK
jgi:hypothetical protein